VLLLATAVDAEIDPELHRRRRLRALTAATNDQTNVPRLNDALSRNATLDDHEREPGRHAGADKNACSRER
jgi:hypothetical protein